MKMSFKRFLPGVMLALFVAAQAQAGVISVAEEITYTDPPTAIIANNNPFLFKFTGLPTAPLTAASVRIFGIGDLGDPGESFDVTVDGQGFGTFSPAGESFDEQFQVALGDLTAMLADGMLEVIVNFSPDVNLPFEGDFITTRIEFRANDNGAVPEPASLALVGLALAGLGVSRRRLSK